MKTYFAKTPRLIMRIFSKYTWRFSFNKKEVFLTFDDGPTPEITEFVLSELKKYEAKATFFCIGKNITKQPEIFQNIISDGHAIGNHTQNHLNGWRTDDQEYINSVLDCENVISRTMKNAVNPKLFRPPYGKIMSSQARMLFKKEYKIIMWDVLSGDFDTSITKEKCLQNVLKNTRKGSIIVFHDSVKAAERMQYALPIVLKIFTEKGFTFSKMK
jgi:peptidoglycan/xylan/chitin deacetylase (PgdA/CDA1 family)